jgi:DNA repair protein RadC
MLTPEGHRGRLRSRFNDNDLGAFEDHEVLELLLTYAIPRKDTKSIARALLARFGTLAATLDADPADLQGVAGIGDGAATLLHLMPRSPDATSATAGDIAPASSPGRTSDASPSMSSRPPITRSSP